MNDRRLLTEVVMYSKGLGKYDFSNLSAIERLNQSFDAWQILEEKIIKEITLNGAFSLDDVVKGQQWLERHKEKMNGA